MSCCYNPPTCRAHTLPPYSQSAGYLFLANRDSAAALSCRKSLPPTFFPLQIISTFSHRSSSPYPTSIPPLNYLSTQPRYSHTQRFTSVPMMVQVQAPEESCATNTRQQQQRFHRICVFCGSSRGNKGIFTDVASTLGQELVSRKIDLVYGGGGNGLMGHVAKTVHNGGGHVVGVIPKALIGQEISGQTVGKLVAVSDMHQRKAEMARQADAFIALPGGYGTLEELLEVITWSQLGIHEKPVGLLNVDGYYNPLLALFDKALEEGFLKFSARSIVVSAPTPSELLDKLEAYTPILDPRAPKLCWEDAEGLVYAPAQ